jgi:TolA-binding protein
MAALEALRNLYIESNQPAAYTKMLRENHLPSADSSSLDSTYYAAAETQFAAGKWENAKQAFTNYLEQYPNGIFAVKAHYYRAESNFQLKKYKEAHEDFNVVMRGPWNDFTENSSRRAAAIAYEQKDYASAYNDYLKLKNNTTGNKVAMAYKGLIRSGYYSGKYAEASAYADSLLAMQGLSTDDSTDAMYFKAKSLQQFDKKEEALMLYQALSNNKNSEAAAEARYRIAEIYLQQNKLTESEAAANESIKLAGGNDYWIIKSFILLADISVKQKDYFNAKATLQSIVKRAKIQELKTEASKKLEEVKKLEKQKNKLSGQ